ncbi:MULTISPECIES: DNA cytosine methyltransferase [Bacillus]|uniref:DNA cytosine methyltransferase n=1 Tax=Bacillus TaxID=1386 RepID=UPI0009757CB1|nr:MULTISPECIES: DNA cytosine methyltransferase [Bacillus]MCK8454800.1 DNA (cytosine-5-)-methyltransferase [Bacillus safensis]MEC1410323.1 DNA cytosine methyltransferase [Bacillus safensis]OMP27491.1 DNA (cytosine-5-)-methyltransferase [Bacillus sp. I-2]
MKKFKVMDLFAGAGGLSNGFEQTGRFEVKVAVEINENARKTFKINHHNDVILHEDITKLQYADENGKKIGEFCDIDVVIGGPPCQGFSNANRQQNTLISSNNNLVKEYLRAIEEIRPLAFVMENVKSMESEKHKFFLSEGDEVELVKLEIEPVEEHIKIGRRTSYSVNLRNFLMNAYEQRTDLTPFMISNELFSKLNTLLKHAKKKSPIDLLRFIEKEANYKFFMKVINKQWLSQHCEYWNSLYQLDWTDLGEKLKNLLDKTTEDFASYTDSLENIIEAQKIIRKISEVIENKVLLFDIEENHDDIEIIIKSFNVFNYIKRKFTSLGYVLNENKYIFNAAHYGVAQERSRLVLMGIKGTCLKTETVKTPEPLFHKKKEYNKIYDAIGDLENISPGVNVKDDELDKSSHQPLLNSPLNNYLNNIDKIYNHVRTETGEVALKRFKALKEGQNFHNLDDSLKTTYTDHSRTQNTIYRRLAYNEPSDTVLNARKSMWVHPVIDRAISIREAARLQSFQDSYKFCGSKDSQYQQIGNAVPPLLARAIAEGILQSLGEEVEENIREILLSNRVVENSLKECAFSEAKNLRVKV